MLLGSQCILDTLTVFFIFKDEGFFGQFSSWLNNLHPAIKFSFTMHHEKIVFFDNFPDPLIETHYFIILVIILYILCIYGTIYHMASFFALNAINPN